VGRRQYPNVDLGGGRGAHPPDFAFLEDAQELGLHLDRNVADLVEEEGSALRGFEQPLVGCTCSRERTSLVAEQLAFEQALGQGGAIDSDERSLGAAAPLVDGARPAPCPSHSHL
jgi:hypothetical protein